MCLTEEIENVININWAEVIVSIIAILVAVKVVWELIDFGINKFGVKFSWKERSKEDHETIKTHSNEMTTLLDSNKQIINRLDTMTTSINKIEDKVGALERESASAKVADQELYADRISQRCRYYINVTKGIPEDELESFSNMFKIYVARGDGNDGLNKKVDYCLNQLPIIPNNAGKQLSNTVNQQ